MAVKTDNLAGVPHYQNMVLSMYRLVVEESEDKVHYHSVMLFCEHICKTTVVNETYKYIVLCHTFIWLKAKMPAYYISWGFIKEKFIETNFVPFIIFTHFNQTTDHISKDNHL